MRNLNKSEAFRKMQLIRQSGLNQDGCESPLSVAEDPRSREAFEAWSRSFITRRAMGFRTEVRDLLSQLSLDDWITEAALGTYLLQALSEDFTGVSEAYIDSRQDPPSFKWARAGHAIISAFQLGTRLSGGELVLTRLSLESEQLNELCAAKALKVTRGGVYQFTLDSQLEQV